MEVLIYHKGLDLRCEIESVYPTFEFEEQGLIHFRIQSVKLEDSEIDILELFDEDIINELIIEKL